LARTVSATDSSAYGRAITHGGTRDGPDPTMPQQPGLGGPRQPLLPLIQMMREQRPESQGKFVVR
jgi:hypothetical protein